MRRALTLALITVACAAIAPAHAQATRRLVIHAAHLIDGRSNTARGPAWVVGSRDTRSAPGRRRARSLPWGSSMFSTVRSSALSKNSRSFAAA